jgi:hypothetical protein
VGVDSRRAHEFPNFHPDPNQSKKCVTDAEERIEDCHGLARNKPSKKRK